MELEMALTGITVVDPDGWREGKGGSSIGFSSPQSLGEFLDRAANSTVDK